MKQLDLFKTKYTYSHFKGGKYKFTHLKDDVIKFDPYNKPWHWWVSDKAKHFTRKSLDAHNLSYSDLSKGY